MKRLIVLAACALSCGSNGSSSSGTERFELRTGGEQFEMQAGETLVVQLLVVGAGGAPVNITSPDLPAFASLDGPKLRLAPTRLDAGSYLLTLVAAAGSQTATAEVRLQVSRYNTAPSWDDWSGTGVMIGDEAGIYPLAPDPHQGPLGGSPAIYIGVCDAEGDAVTVDLEIVPVGQTFSKVPTHSLTSALGGQSDRCSYGLPNLVCSCLKIPLTQLTLGASYQFAVRVTDAFGAVATVHGANDGWGQQSYNYRFEL